MPDQKPSKSGPRMPIRIGFNAALRSPSNDYRAAGMHRYIVGLLGGLELDEDMDLNVYAPEGSRDPKRRILWEQLRLPRIIKKDNIDLLHGPAHALPWMLPKHIASVVTVHDLSFLRMPEVFPASKARYLQAVMQQAASKADAIISVSEFSKSELVNCLGVEPDRVTVVHNGIESDCKRASREEIDKIQRRYGLPNDYVLTLGTLQPRKNLETLIRAYARWRQEDPTIPDLVVAGASGWGETDPAGLAAELGIESKLYLPGFVDAQDLPALYGGALCLTFPSLYEGFGLPALEAMAYGTPVIVADSSSLPEVVEDAGLCVPPADIGAWIDAMRALNTKPELRGTLRSKGLARAAQFSWTRSADETAQVYRDVMARRAHSKCTLQSGRPQGAKKLGLSKTTELSMRGSDGHA